MSWLLFFQIWMCIVLAYLLIVVLMDHYIDKRREDDIKRKEAGL